MIEKPILIILPGWGGSHQTWQEFITLASAHFTVECIDLPCFGDTPCPDTVWGIEEYADYVKSKVQSQKLALSQVEGSKVILLGHSFGGQVAIALAAKHPEVIEKLILSGAAVFRPRKRIRRIWYVSIAKVGKNIFRLPFIERFDGLAKKILYRAADSPDYAATAGIKRDIYKKIIRQDYTHALTQISVPTMVTWGSRDRVTPLADGRRLARLLPNAKLTVFDGGGHALHREMVKPYLDSIRVFVSNVIVC